MRGTLVTSPLTEDATAAWARGRGGDVVRPRSFRLPRLGLRVAGGGETDARLELGFRSAAVQVGYWLGWAAIVVVLGGLAFDVGARHRWPLVVLTLAAAAANTVAMVVPW